MKFFVLISVESESSSHHENRHASEDPNTTNLFINTIPRVVRIENFSSKIRFDRSKRFQMNETNIMELFGRYGPLASVKIMYPRTDEEKSRLTNCGFVAYMSRKDAERAMNELNGSQLESITVRMNWGRCKTNNFISFLLFSLFVFSCSHSTSTCLYSSKFKRIDFTTTSLRFTF